MGRTQRKKWFTGVYHDKAGVSIVVSVRGKPREFRHDEHEKPYARYDRHTLKDERKRVQLRENVLAERARARAHTVAHDLPRYYDTLSGSHRRNTKSYLAHFERAFGERARDEITELDLQQWFAAIDKKPSTKNHIRHAVISFYQTLNGPQGANPARVLKKVREEYPDARALSYDAIEAIFKALTPSPAKARLMVMAYTGLPQHLIAKITPHHLHLERAEVWATPRRKGAGAEGRMLHLSKKGVEAFKEFVRVNAFGSFQNKQLTSTFRHGAKLAKITLPEQTRPYDLRHSFLTETLRETGDLHAVSELAMHATLEQTKRYTRGAASERATKAITSVPRFGATRRTGKSPKVAKRVHGAIPLKTRGKRRA